MEEQAGNNGPLCDKLLEIVKKTRPADIELKCDVCKRNPVVLLCTNCILCLCKVCYEHHSEENNEHTIVPLDKASFCSEHNKIVKYYCENCDQFACSSCEVKHSSEDNHNLGIIEEMAIKHRNMLTEGIAQIDKTNEALLKTEANFTSTQRNLEEQLSEVKRSIDNQYKAQLKKLKERHDQIEKELSDVRSQKLGVLETHLEEIKSIKNEASEVKKILEDLKKTSDHKVFSTKKQMMKFYVQQVNDQFKSLTSKPVGPPNLIKFNPAPDSSEVLGQLFLDVEIQNLPKSVFKDEAIEFLIRAKNEQNQYCTEGGSQVSAELKSSTNDVTTGAVKDNKDGSYTVQIKARQIGEAMLSVSINGLRIKGSPFTIKVSPAEDAPHKTVLVNCDGKMGRPWGIAFSKNDIWAVTDDTNHCVYLFSSHNQLVCKFGEQGSEVGKFNRPFGVEFDSNGYLYVVDGGNNRVQKFNTNGEFQNSFGTKGSGDGELEGPYGITIHSDKAYIADFHNKRISVFKTEGSFCLSFGSGHLEGPRDVTVSNSGQVLVADHRSHKIYIFTLDGDFVKAFGEQGNTEGDLNSPLSITTTWNKQILLSDENHCVSFFDENGQFVGCLGCCRGVAKGELNFPNGIAIKSNDIYVTDHTNQRVQIFNLPKDLRI